MDGGSILAYRSVHLLCFRTLMHPSPLPLAYGGYRLRQSWWKDTPRTRFIISLAEFGGPCNNPVVLAW